MDTTITPIGLTDRQLRLVEQAAKAVPVRKRSEFLQQVAKTFDIRAKRRCGASRSQRDDGPHYATSLNERLTQKVWRIEMKNHHNTNDDFEILPNGKKVLRDGRSYHAGLTFMDARTVLDAGVHRMRPVTRVVAADGAPA
jgi:hypothetical protein